MPAAGEPGTPLAGLSDEESARFHAGSTLFNRIYTPEDGLGPAFNENQCSACHTVPAAGGTTGFERVTKATREGPGGRCDPMHAEGGPNVRTQVTAVLRALGIERETVPTEATHVGRFLPPFLFGLGLVEAIPASTITARADPDDRDRDGISGRAARAADGGLMRFGRKSDHATLEDFTRSALLLEMGLTSRDTDRDLVNGRAAPEGTDPARDPEIDALTVSLLTDFVRFLAPPAPAEPRSPQHADSIAAGRGLFHRAGCAECHTPIMRTGASESAVLSHRTLYLYSDLLLHDMGPGLVNACSTDADAQELRTTPLMGLRYREFYLHDGRAIDLRDAILEHGGEAQGARNAFARLPYLRQHDILIFLMSL